MTWIPAAVAVAQLGIQAYKTYADRKADEELKELEGEKKAGFPQDERERQMYEEMYMTPGRQALGESQLKGEAAMTALGAHTAGDVQMREQERREQAAELAQNTGAAMTSRAVESAAEKQARLDSLRAYTGQRQADLLDSTSDIASGVGKAYGTHAVMKNYLDSLDPDLLDRMKAAGGFDSDEEALLFYEYLADKPEEIDRILKSG